MQPHTDNIILVPYTGYIETSYVRF
jgi:hypothetical protein